MRILVTGANGMLARALTERFDSQDLIQAPREILDVTDSDAVRRSFDDRKPECVLHTAAFTDVDAAEREEAEAYRVNAFGARNVAVACFEIGATMVHFSTDYVFDGRSQRAYRESDRPNPISIYGRTKLDGEEFVRSLCPAHLVIRTSWLFGPGEQNFVTRIVERAKESDRLEVVDDQRGSPTYTLDLAEAVAALLKGNARGLYHVTGTGSCSRAELAEEVLQNASSSATIVKIPSTRFPQAAPRPCNSELENYRLKTDGYKPLPAWNRAVASFLKTSLSV